MDGILRIVLDQLAKEAARLGNEYIQKGLALIERLILGEATDAEIIAWLKTQQES